MTIQLLLKRFFLLAALFSLALTPGCGGDDPAEDPGSGSVPEPEPDPKPDEPEEYAVKFAPSFVAPASGSQIGIFGYETGDTPWSVDAVPNFMCNQLLENVDGEWTYDPVKYWPESSTGKLSFFACSPYAAAGSGLSLSDSSRPGAPVLEYEMPSATECHNDICIAAPQLNLTRSEEPVALELRSVMSKIGFRIKGQGEKISGIAVRGIQWQGSIALDAENQGSMTWSTTSDFSTTEYELKLKCDAGQEYATASETMTDVTAEGGHLYLIPQNITYNARIVVTVDGTKLGFPFEDLFQLLPGQEYTIDLVIPGSKPLDYTDNAMPAFLLAPVDAAEAANVSWADAKSACEASGYRLPTYNEGLMILFYMNGMEKNNLRFASYWTSTTLLEDPTGQSAMGYNIMPWMGLYMPKVGITAARCVKDAPGGGKKYPYVDTSRPEGPVIVSRDADGGVIPSAYNSAFGAELQVFHDNWTTTPDHDWGTDADRIPRKVAGGQRRRCNRQGRMERLRMSAGLAEADHDGDDAHIHHGRCGRKLLRSRQCARCRNPAVRRERIHSAECRLLLGGQHGLQPRRQEPGYVVLRRNSPQRRRNDRRPRRQLYKVRAGRRIAPSCFTYDATVCSVAGIPKDAGGGADLRLEPRRIGFFVRKRVKVLKIYLQFRFFVLSLHSQ
ncbi:MAG: fimbrillin family protein [Alistipes finegoldii]